MKSRIKLNTTPMIIGYMIQEQHLDGLQNAADLLSATLKLCDVSCAGEKVGYLAQFNGFEENKINLPNPPAEECLILSGFTGKSMDRLLSALKKYNVQIPLKCVVTQHNQKWELYKLIDELKKEHSQMNK